MHAYLFLGLRLSFRGATLQIYADGKQQAESQPKYRL
jgi:hypothetical protein